MKKKTIINILLVVAIGLICFSGVMLYQIMNEYKSGEDEYNKTGEIAFRESEAADGTKERVVDLKALREINPDTVGWIEFENIKISYPIVRGEDNEYYLTHTFNKTENKAASIFMDWQNDRKFGDKNTLIYGHNMKSKSMFGLLNDYRNIDFYKENAGFYIYDDTGKHYYEIISCHEVKDDSAVYRMSFSTVAEFQEYVEWIKEDSIYPIDAKINVTDKLVLLSTCTKRDDYRFVVHAVKR